ncbi:MAG: tRNA (adenosine(37)-N6)-threonylcarbamoyltransferase complex dimerization subunit type 1 TsaB, partial [Bacteroidetes bacterium]|nr:tRNA (adenosine(37)-N6)-threonylcarbamoyltransferase complex dimerization subunit type 1 TsaB [Bacteroidota bacterium]
MNKKNTVILAIESSCDDTSAAVLVNDKLLSNKVANQEVHINFGGVVPELASRAHQKNIIPVVDQALKQAGVKPADIDAIAFTRGPGLMGSLLVGTSFAKGFALAQGIPLIDINHLQAHVLALFIQDSPENRNPVP